VSILNQGKGKEGKGENAREAHALSTGGGKQDHAEKKLSRKRRSTGAKGEKADQGVGRDKCEGAPHF